MISIGLMSGTSMDGIDAALLETDGSAHLLKEREHTFLAYSPAFKILLKAAEYAVRKEKGDKEKANASYLQSIKEYLNIDLCLSKKEIDIKIKELASYLFGYGKRESLLTLEDVIKHSTYLHKKIVHQLLKETGIEAKDIDVIGYHGQALFHQPSEGISIVVGNGQDLADQTGITVINDFRSRDVMAGGQGAPFAPIYHHALAIRDNKVPIAVINCGGVANITFIPSIYESDLVGFDTGPGNALVDRLVKQRTCGRENMDMNGQYGKKGTIQEDILRALYEKSVIKNGKNYFQQKIPKSLDSGDMRLISELEELSLEDACATLEAFTADTIVYALELLKVPVMPKIWVLSGGGWKNSMIRKTFEQKLVQKFGLTLEVVLADEIGWNSQALEAQIFAYLAVRSLQNKPLSLPNTTQVPKPLSGGKAFIPKTGTTSRVEELLRKNPAVLLGYSNIS